jgi:hypothetical protein
MDNFEQALEYISFIDNTYSIEHQNNILTNINIEQCNTKKQEVTNLIDNLSNLELFIQYTKEKLNNFNNQINIKKTQLDIIAKQANQTSCKNIEELCKQITNPNQVAILQRIITDKEYSKIYLSGYESNTEITGKKKNLIGTVKVLGTFNEKKKCREEYEIKLLKDDSKGMFWCSCADHKFNSTKKNIVCKHICFLICKISKVLKPSVFEHKKLSETDLTALLAKLTASGDIWSDKTISKIIGKITLDTFKQFIKAIEDCCPLCFNDLEEADKPNLLACPTCKNYIHKECAEIWMEQKNTCAMCRSDFWKHYEKVKLGSSISITK